MPGTSQDILCIQPNCVWWRIVQIRVVHVLHSMDYETHNPRRYLRCLWNLLSEGSCIFCKKGQLDRFRFFLEGMATAQKYCCVVSSCLDCVSKQGWYLGWWWWCVDRFSQWLVNIQLIAKSEENTILSITSGRNNIFSNIYIFKTKIGVRSISLL